MNNLQLELSTAAFAKMAQGEPLSLADAQRVWEVILANGRNIDTANQNGAAQFYSQVKSALHQQYFNNGN